MKQKILNKGDLKWIRQSRFNRATVSNVGYEVIAVGQGSGIQFVNVLNGSETCYRVVAPYSGVACICGHPDIALFAFAEQSNESRIILMTFPDFREICILGVNPPDQMNKAPKTIRRICCMTFSDSEHLVVLTGFPEYVLEVWNWRTQKLLGSHASDIYTDMQFLKCSRTMPTTVIQCSYDLGLANFWELYPSVDSVSIIKRPLEIPGGRLNAGPFGGVHLMDGSVMVTNSTLKLWHIQPSNKKITQVFDNISSDEHSVAPQPSAVKIDTDRAEHLSDIDNKQQQLFLLSYRGNLALIEPDGPLRIFKKNPPHVNWHEIHRLETDVKFLYVTVLRCPEQQLLCGITENGEFVLLEDDNANKQQWKTVKQFNRLFKFIDAIQPLGEILIIITENNHLHAVRMDSCIAVDSVTTSSLGNVTCIDSCATLPLLAIANDGGVVQLYSMYDSKCVRFINQGHLSDHAIVSVKVGRSGTCLVAVDKSNALFVLQVNLGQQISIINYVQLDQHPISVSINMSLGQELVLTTLLAPIEELQRSHSNKIFQIVHKLSSGIEKWHGVLTGEYTSVQWLWREEHKHDDNIFVVVPYLSTVFEVVRVAKDSSGLSFEVLQTCQTAHSLHFFELRIFADYLLTWSIDGIVLVWDTAHFTMTSRYQALTLWSKGVRTAVSNFNQQLIVCLGHEGNLLCLQNTNSDVDNNKIFKTRKLLHAKGVEAKFSKPTLWFKLREEDVDMSWVQIQQKEQMLAERSMYAIERRQCLDDLAEIKEKLKDLIDANETAPDDEQLVIDEFDLDTKGTALQKANAEIERTYMQSCINQERASLGELANVIVSKTWKQMEVKGRNVRGIFTKLKVENYSLTFEEPSNAQHLQRARMWRDTEQLVAEGDVFKPWEPSTPDSLMIQFHKKPSCKGFGSNDSFTEKASQESLVAVSKNKYSLTGTSSHAFIQPIPIRYDQLEVVSYFQMMLENIFGYNDVLSLRKYFNKKFDEMSSVKEQELQLANQRNDRLRHIQSELNKLEELKSSGIYHERPIVDPVNLPDEMPERIVKVEAHELSITPYVSPSEQALMDEAAAEEERRRLALLADDFRDRALMKMMNGVLEIRWEDEIKKTPPQPDCIRSGKDPKDYTPEDLAAIMAWEAEIEHLKSERERYRDMLLGEQDKIDKILEDQIKKFNLKVGATLMEKIKVEFAIATEDLKLLRNRQYNYRRCYLANKERMLSRQAKEIKAEITADTEVLNQLEDKLTAYKNRYEDLSQKDRYLDRHFKSSFGEIAAKPVVDQAYRMFRRRPKWQMRAWQTPAILMDMARRTIATDAKRNGPPLPEECFQFLQQVDQVDKLSNAPNLMDANSWQMLCKMRRVKLETEFRVKSLAAQVADAEATVNAYTREIAAKKAKVAQLNLQEAETLKQRVENLANRTAQICIKRGSVEIPLSGHISDFSNAILLHCSDVHDINQIIKKAGQKKLKTMQNAAVFRRKITMKEWEHEVLHMRIAEKQLQLKCIERTKITKEIQTWIKFKKMGWKEDISDSALSREVEASRKSLEFMCNEIISKINETNARIDLKKRNNARLDAQIRAVNLDLTELNLARDIEKEKRVSDERQQRLKMMMHRSQLVRDIQLNHAKILEMCTVLELQRLRTFPTLKMVSLDLDQSDC